MKIISILLLVFSIFVVGCTSTEEPAEALDEMISLYAERNFEKLINERYAELYKAESQSDIDSLKASFERRFSDPSRLEQAISLLKSAKDVEPEIMKSEKLHESHAGEVAVFELESGSIKLILLETEKWGFTL